jgi:23S rRNA (guanosine2251-2'-O)-methyltransferase
MKVTLVLDNLRSVYNVGSIFRTANACGVSHIILCGTTPTPLDKYGEKRKDFGKVALGAEETVSWEYVESTVEKLKLLKEEGYYIIAVEQDEKSLDYKEVSIKGKEKISFVIGPEVTGMSGSCLDKCDVIAEISMLGTKESLNVTIAAGIALYRILGI